MFLAVIKKTVVDQKFVPAVAEVLDTDGTTVLTPAVPEVPLVTHEEIERCYVEDSAATVAKVMAMQADNPNAFPYLKFYSLKFNANTLRPSIKDVREKGRVTAPVKQIVTIEDADGNELGTGEI